MQVKDKELLRRRRRAHRVAAGGAAGTAPVASGAQAGVESELKFGVPDAEWDDLVQAMSGPDAAEVPLHAVYFETSDGALAAAGIALRVRREGDQWVQTLKAKGDGPFRRVEDNVPLGPVLTGQGAPAAELGRHELAQARAALDAALPHGIDAGPALQPVYEVEVTRRRRQLVQGHSLVEVALDEGHIKAAGRSRSIRELELELLEGSFDDLLQLARRWRERHGLWLASASKAERGQWLARGQLHGPAVGASAPALPARPTLGQFTGAVLAECLHHVLGNAGEIAAGSQADDHVHQLRVGLRRLRSALRELPPLADARAGAEPALVAVFRALGERRDRTHVLRKVQPLVEAAGGPGVQVPPAFHDGADPGEQVRGGAFQDALMALLLQAEAVRAQKGGKVRATLRPVLERLHRQVTRDGRRFPLLAEDRQHQVRKRLKRLRYLSEFMAPLYPARRAEKFLAALKPAQDALGEYNDEVMARALYQELVGSDPGAGFGVQWLASRRAAHAQACRDALRRLRKARPFWDKG